MEIVNDEEVVQFCRRHADAKGHLEAWRLEVSRASWKKPEDLLKQYPRARIIGGGQRAIFNICGNRYRLVVEFDFVSDRATIRFLDTHGKYDRIDAETV